MMEPEKREAFEQQYRYYCVPLETRQGVQVSRGAMMCKKFGGYHPLLESAAEDLAIETLFEIFTSEDFTYSSSGAFRRYYAIRLRGKTIDFFREQSRKSVGQEVAAARSSPLTTEEHIIRREELSRLCRLLEKFPDWLASLALGAGVRLLNILKRLLDNDDVMLLAFLYSEHGHDTDLKDNICIELKMKLNTCNVQLSRLKTAWYAFEFLDGFNEMLNQEQVQLQEFRDHYLASEHILLPVWDVVVESVKKFPRQERSLGHEIVQQANDITTKLSQMQIGKMIYDRFNHIKTLGDKWQEFLRRR